MGALNTKLFSECAFRCACANVLWKKSLQWGGNKWLGRKIQGHVSREKIIWFRAAPDPWWPRAGPQPKGTTWELPHVKFLGTTTSCSQFTPWNISWLGPWPHVSPGTNVAWAGGWRSCCCHIRPFVGYRRARLLVCWQMIRTCIKQRRNSSWVVVLAPAGPCWRPAFRARTWPRASSRSWWRKGRFPIRKNTSWWKAWTSSTRSVANSSVKCQPLTPQHSSLTLPYPQFGRSKMGYPVFYYIARRYINTDIREDILMYYILQALKPYSARKFDVIIDLTHVESKNGWELFPSGQMNIFK